MKELLDPFWREYCSSRLEALMRGTENAMAIWVRTIKFEAAVTAVLPGATFYWTEDGGCIVNNTIGFAL
jgi:hypothetical protein